MKTEQSLSKNISNLQMLNWPFHNYTKEKINIKLDVDPQWDDDASLMSSSRLKVQWCKLVET